MRGFQAMLLVILQAYVIAAASHVGQALHSECRMGGACNLVCKNHALQAVVLRRDTEVQVY